MRPHRTMRLQLYRYKVVYKSGKLNIADLLSRKDEPFDEECDTYMNAILCSAAVDITEIEEASKHDVVLQLLKEVIDDRNFDL